ncbi:putative epimerase [Tieghemostelium lacteum]|uniref:Putative epimerase n=1 Tax=Tieghemostelium lacteum TaxID=361077 RepID=A0A151Z5I2_TIELA|nr:putative epimerase [Tieghemostelium lacteum]|eukprot:KYQ89195.1 putative epimerase [Tieghemostelium lacteum]
MTKLISVFGATGAQGGSVARALLKNGYKVRAFSRNIDSASSLELKKLGAELYKIDMDQPECDIQKALENSDGLFLVTNFWSFFEKEEEYGKKVVNAALKANIKHIVFSGLSACKEISKGKYNVPHFDLKHKIEDYIRQLSKQNPNFVSSFVYAPFYMQNFSTAFMPKKNEHGTYNLSMPQDPNVPLDMGDIDDIGEIVLAQFNNPQKYSGMIVPFTGSYLTGEEIAKKLSNYTGKTVNYCFVPPNEFAKLPFPGAGEMAQMFGFYNEYGAFYKLDKSIAPSITKLHTFDDFLKQSNFQLL